MVKGGAKSLNIKIKGKEFDKKQVSTKDGHLKKEVSRMKSRGKTRLEPNVQRRGHGLRTIKTTKTSKSITRPVSKSPEKFEDPIEENIHEKSDTSGLRQQQRNHERVQSSDNTSALRLKVISGPTASFDEMQSINQHVNQLSRQIQYNAPKRMSPLRLMRTDTDINRTPKNLANQLPTIENDTDEKKIIRPQPVNEIQPFVSRKMEKAFNKQEDKVKTLNLDNSSIRRQIEIAKLDLENQIQAKLEMQRQLEEQTRDAPAQNRDLESIGSPAKEGSFNMKNQIAAERRANEQLQERIANMKNYNKVSHEVSVETIDDRITVKQVVEKLTYELVHRTQDLKIVQRQNLGVRGQIEILQDQMGLKHKEQDELLEELRSLEIERDRAAAEKLTLFNQLKLLNTKFDLINREMNADHFYLKRGNDFNNKRVAGTIIMRNLDIFLHNSLKSAFSEIADYSNFDDHCYNNLKTLAKVMNRVGKYKLRSGLHQWYDNSMKPLQTIAHNDKLAFKIYQGRFLARTFFAWREFHNDRLNAYQSKTNSIALIWTKLNQSREKEIKRVLSIWKEKVRFTKHREQTLQKLLFSRMHFQLGRSLLIWKDFSYMIGNECRIILLQREYANKIYLNVVFQKLKQECSIRRQSRIRYMNKAVKAWKEYIMYKRHLFWQNVQASKFLITRKNMTTRIIFNEFKRGWRSQQFEILRHALWTDMDVSLEGYNTLNRRHKQTFDRSSQMKAGNIFRDALCKQLFSYFKKWRDVTDQFNTRLSSRVTDLIIKAYRMKLRNTFNLYRQNTTQKQIRTKKKKMLVMQEEQLAMENESIVQVKEQKVQAEAVKSIRNKHYTKTFKNFMLRKIGVAFGRWRDRVVEMNIIKAKNENVFTKTRKRMLRELFDMYLDFLKRSRQHDKNLNSADYFVETLRIRKLRTHYNAICVYTSNHTRAKRYCRKLLTRIDHWQKKSTIKTWKENAAIKLIYDLQQLQNEKTQQIEQKNHKIGQDEVQNDSTEKHMKELQHMLKHKAHKQLGNYMVRFYDETTAAIFKRWKHGVKYQGQKDKLLKRTIEHYRKQQMTLVRNAFKTFVSIEVCKNRKIAIKQATMVGDDEVHAMQYAELKMVKMRNKAQDLQVKAAAQQDFHRNRRDKARSLLERRNMTLTFISKKRKVFEALRNTGKQHRAFCLCVSTVLTKSLATKGFTYLHHVARENHLNQLKKRHMDMMIFRFLKKNVGDYLNKWKNGALIRVEGKFAVVSNDHNENVAFFDKTITNVKEQNTKNIEHFITKRRLKAIYKGWRKLSQKNKTRRLQTEDFEQVLASVIQKRYLQKWFLRVDRTKLIRRNKLIMKTNKALRLKQMVWQGILSRRKISTHLTSSLCNLEHMLLDKVKIEAFRTLQSYTNSKEHASQGLKYRALLDMGGILDQYHTERLRRYFTKYKHIVQTKVKKNLEAKRILLKIQIGHIRWAFIRWAKQTDKIVAAQDMNETGPVTEQVFEANRCIKNLVCFMQNEKFTQEEIQAKLKHISDINQHQMSHLVCRLKIPKEDRQMARCFDHWVMWLKVKRLMKYHLNFANASVQAVKCDIRWAFEKWKKADANFANYLSKMDNQTLQQMNCKQSDLLNKLADREAEDGAMISHLNTERDMLLGHQIRSKRLALALLHDNYIKDLRTPVIRWQVFKRAMNKKAGANTAALQVDELAAFKQRTAELEKENAQIATENEQLRQFSFEGFEIAKTVTQLADDKKRLTKELADQDGIVKNLQEQQEKIIEQLKEMGKLDELGPDKHSKFMRQTFVRGDKGQVDVEYSEDWHESPQKQQ